MRVPNLYRYLMLNNKEYYFVSMYDSDVIANRLLFNK